MMRIQIDRSEDHLIIRVEGHLTGTYASELEQCWRGVACGPAANKVPRGIVVDVTGVLTIDRAGRRLLQSMHTSGVIFIGAVLGIQDILDEITGRKPGNNVQGR